MTEKTARVLCDPTLKPCDEVVYEIILDTWRDHGFAPSQAELCSGSGRGKESIRRSLIRLKEKGYIVHPPFSNRSIKPVDLNAFIVRDPGDAAKYEGEPFLDRAPPDASKLSWERQENSYDQT
mgnify:CR=1 FL=1